jgi:transcriptional regulator with XRE-family HTH domain
MEQTVRTPARGNEQKKAENELALQEFGRELKRVRKARRYTQKRLHELTGIDETVISDLENGNYTPSLALIRQLAEGLNISPYTLVAAYYGLPLPDFNQTDREALDNFIKLAMDYINQSQPQPGQTLLPPLSPKNAAAQAGEDLGVSRQKKQAAERKAQTPTPLKQDISKDEDKGKSEGKDENP